MEHLHFPNTCSCFFHSYHITSYSSIYILKVCKAPNQSVVKNIMFFMSFQPDVSFHGSNTPSIETHLAVVRGFPTKKFQTECVNEKSSTERRS